MSKDKFTCSWIHTFKPLPSIDNPGLKDEFETMSPEMQRYVKKRTAASDDSGKPTNVANTEDPNWILCNFEQSDHILHFYLVMRSGKHGIYRVMIF
jgi:hypothetical protein